VVMRNVAEVWITFESSPKSAFSRRPVALVIHVNAGQRVVGFSQRVIQSDRTIERSFRFRPNCVRQYAIGSAERVEETESGVGQRVIRVELDRLFEILAHLIVTWGKESLPMIPSFEVELVRGAVFGWSRRNR